MYICVHSGPIIYEEACAAATDTQDLWNMIQSLYYMVAFQNTHKTLLWCHMSIVSNHRQLDCLFNSLFWLTWKKTSKSRNTGPFWGNPPVTGGSPHKGPVMRKAFPCHDAFIKHHMDYLWGWDMAVRSMWDFYMFYILVNSVYAICSYEFIYTTTSPWHGSAFLVLKTVLYYEVRSWNNGLRCMSLYILMRGGFSTIKVSKAELWPKIMRHVLDYIIWTLDIDYPIKTIWWQPCCKSIDIFNEIQGSMVLRAYIP